MFNRYYRVAPAVPQNLLNIAFPLIFHDLNLGRAVGLQLYTLVTMVRGATTSEGKCIEEVTEQRYLVWKE